MAIGAARMFGIVLPQNFNSPYKARDIIDFWRRWHMTLSRFLRDYVYIPLGGNRRGAVRRHGNLLATMLLGGLWHGAGWNFVIWGGLHGAYLIVNHGWSRLASHTGLPRLGCGGAVVTFLAVVVAWVFFRAPTLDGALVMVHAMFGGNGVALPAAVAYRIGALAPVLQALGVQFPVGGGGAFVGTWGWTLALGLAAFLLPNTQDVLRRYRPVLERTGRRAGRWYWQPTPLWGAYTALLFGLGILALPQVSAFLYFQF